MAVQSLCDIGTCFFFVYYNKSDRNFFQKSVSFLLLLFSKQDQKKLEA